MKPKKQSRQQSKSAQQQHVQQQPEQCPCAQYQSEFHVENDAFRLHDVDGAFEALDLRGAIAVWYMTREAAAALGAALTRIGRSRKCSDVRFAAYDGGVEVEASY